MQSWIRQVGLGIAAVVLAAAGQRAEAQGTTFAAVQGTITQAGAAGRPIESAAINVVNGSNGQRYSATARSNGRYNVENVAVGGPYTIEVRAIGYQAVRQTGVTLALGQRLEASFALTASVVQLQDVVVAN